MKPLPRDIVWVMTLAEGAAVALPAGIVVERSAPEPAEVEEPIPCERDEPEKEYDQDASPIDAPADRLALDVNTQAEPSA